MQKATLIGTLTLLPSRDGAELTQLPPQLDWLEVRADRVGEPDVSMLRRHFAGKLVYTLRSRAEGGGFAGDAEQRARHLRTAAQEYDYVDLEAQRDLAPEVLEAVPAQKRLLSWHGPPSTLAELTARFERMAATEAAWYKLIPEARRPGDELAPLLLLHALGRRDVVSFASGEHGTWTRLLAPRLGGPLVYAAIQTDAIQGEPGAPGQLELQRLVNDYGLPDLPPVSALCGIVGDPVRHSLSPRLHNAAYRALDLPFLYLPFGTDSFADFWLGVVENDNLSAIGYPLRGLSVTAPYKDIALAISGASSPLAERIGAANTLVLHEGVWEAESTDPAGVVEPLRARGVELQGRRAAVVGCGGAGRSAAIGLALAGVRVTLSNRSRRRGEEASQALGLPFVPLDDLAVRLAEDFDILVNATSLGRSDDDPLPFDVEALPTERAPILVDLVYRRRPTPLVEACRRRGLGIVDGREVLLFQAVDQFRWMIGHDLPLDIARQQLGLLADSPAPPDSPALPD